MPETAELLLYNCDENQTIFENMESLSSRKWPLQSLYYCKKGTSFLAPPPKKSDEAHAPIVPRFRGPWFINAKPGNISLFTDFISALNMVQQIKLFKINVELKFADPE
jgi:hypothetical protein